MRQTWRPLFGLFAWNINCELVIGWIFSVIGGPEPSIGHSSQSRERGEMGGGGAPRLFADRATEFLVLTTVLLCKKIRCTRSIFFFFLITLSQLNCNTIRRHTGLVRLLTQTFPKVALRFGVGFFNHGYSFCLLLQMTLEERAPQNKTEKGRKWTF